MSINPKDIIEYATAGTEVAKTVGALVSAAGVSVVGRKMLGALSDAVGRRWTEDEDRRAWERQHKTLRKAVEFCDQIGADSRTIPVKILAPWLEGVALEENEDLQVLWAALLANAADPQSGDKVRPSFVSILKEMAPDEAQMLNWIHDNGAHSHFVPHDQIVAACSSLDDPGVILDALEAAQLIRRGDFGYSATLMPAGESGEFIAATVANKSRATRFDNRNDKSYVITDLGRAFVKACRLPTL